MVTGPSPDDLEARRAYWDDKYLKYWEARTADQRPLSGDCVPADVAMIERYLDLLEIAPGDAVLDVGIGFGRLVPALVRRGADVYGVDISRAMIAEAQRQVGADVKELRVDSAETISFESGRFDAVLCWAVFDACHQGDALRQMARVLRLGGRLLVSGKNDDYCDDDDLAYIAEVNARGKGHPNFFTSRAKLVDAVQALGLREVATTYFVRRGDGSTNTGVTVRPPHFYEYVMICAKERHVEAHERLDVARRVSLTCARRQAAQEAGRT